MQQQQTLVKLDIHDRLMRAAVLVNAATTALIACWYMWANPSDESMGVCLMLPVVLFLVAGVHEWRLMMFAVPGNMLCALYALCTAFTTLMHMIRRQQTPLCKYMFEHCSYSTYVCTVANWWMLVLSVLGAISFMWQANECFKFWARQLEIKEKQLKMRPTLNLISQTIEPPPAYEI